MDLKIIREQKGYTQQQLAQEIKKDRSLIAKIEAGITFPSVGTAKAIANVLKIDWTLFFKKIGEEHSHKIQK